MTPEPLLTVEGLGVSYGAIAALHGVSLSVEPGRITALIGANGAGKSTLLRALSGLVRPKAGRILFRGEDLDRLDAHAIVARGLIHVPEGRRIFPDLTVLENLRLGAYSRRDRAGIKDDLDRTLTRFPRLAERRSQRAGTLSGGEQQMLAMGRGLMARPALLLLDEPSLGLAPQLVDEIFAIIRQIHAQGTAMLLVEQNAHMALGVADRATVLEHGQVILEGPAADLARDPRVRAAYLGNPVDEEI